jgi:hypothetical protein
LVAVAVVVAQQQLLGVFLVDLAVAVEALVILVEQVVRELQGKEILVAVEH